MLTKIEDHIFTEQMWEIFLWFKGIWIKIELTKKLIIVKDTVSEIFIE